MFRKILVHDISRLSRWLGGLGALRDRLEANGVTVVSVTEAAGESTTGQSTPSRAGLVEG